MEGIDFPSKPICGNWEVYQDAFALPPPSRSMKAWERAHVPARAPRLQGQKIWKKVGIKPQREYDGKNFDSVQNELEMEGNGARKRMRATCLRENMGDAPWMKNPEVLDVRYQENGGAVENESSMPLPMNDCNANALQFIPRKRTNTNHVITPRKPLRQATLNLQAQTERFEEPSDNFAEKPVRRRKSTRKSIRKSIAGRIPEANGHSLVDDPTVDVFVNDTTQPTIVREEKPGQPEAQIDIRTPAAEATQSKELKQLSDLTGATQPIIKEDGQGLGGGSDHLSDRNKYANGGIEMTSNNLDEQPKKPFSPVLREEFVITEDKEKVDIDEEQSPQHLRQPIATQSAILEIIETEVTVDAVPTGKNTGTPKKRNGTNQRIGPRRSTRKTRSSLVRVEEVVPFEVKDSEPSQNAPSSHLPTVGNDHVVEMLVVEELHLNLANEMLVTQNEAVELVEGNVQETMDVTDPLTKGSIHPDADQAVPQTVSQLRNELSEFRVIKARPSLLDTVDGELESFEIFTESVSKPPAVDLVTEIQDTEFELSAVPVSLTDLRSSVEQSGEQVQRELISEADVYLVSPSEIASFDHSTSVRNSPNEDDEHQLSSKSEELTAELIEDLEPISGDEFLGNVASTPPEHLPETSPPALVTSDLVEATSENAPPAIYDHDDTDMLRNFLTRVKANKAANSQNHIPNGKESLPHSPLGLPLREVDTNISPSPQNPKDEFDVSAIASPSKRRKPNKTILDDEDVTEPKSIRRSGRTRLPVKAQLGAPSFIPVRRLGQDGDTTVTLRQSEEKELAALTRVNTRKNKCGALSPAEVLAKKAEEREDPMLRQRLLKEVFDEKAQKGKKETKRKSVVWAEELAQFQTTEAKMLDSEKEQEKEKESAARVGIRSKIALGMAINGTPAPKRRRR